MTVMYSKKQCNLVYKHISHQLFQCIVYKAGGKQAILQYLLSILIRKVIYIYQNTIVFINNSLTNIFNINIILYFM